MATTKDTITLVGMTTPVEKKILKDHRNEADPEAPLDITGYTIKLIVKNSVDDVDSRVLFELSATLVTPTSGVYSFTFTTKHTSLAPGVYPGELRWWTGVTTVAATDAIPVDFEILSPIDTVV